jgi:hypothetical protein
MDKELFLAIHWSTSLMNVRENVSFKISFDNYICIVLLVNTLKSYKEDDAMPLFFFCINTDWQKYILILHN